MRYHRSLLALPACLGIACASDGHGNVTAGASSITGTSSASASEGATTGPAGDDGNGGASSGSGVDSGGTTAASTAAPTTTATGMPVTTVDTDAGTSGGGVTAGDPTEGATSSPAPDPSTGDGTTGGDAPPPGTPTDENLLVALVGDQGTGSNTKEVYQLILAEKADLLIILGDFDYGDDPDGWAAEMKGELGDSFPVFGAVGNHDKQEWKSYQAHLQTRLENIPGAVCTGDLGVMSSCNYRGLHFILSGIGTIGSDSDHEAFIADTLAADDSLWSLCAWHKNMRDLQAGDKPDEITWKAVQNCQDSAAIVLMGHEHSYARTLTLTDVGNEKGGHGAVGVPELMEVEAGSTFSVCSGLGGRSIRAYEPSLHDDDTWWSTLYTEDYYRKNGVEIDDFEADHGVLFMRFHVDGDPALAHGYFKNVKGEIIDEFDAVRR